MSENTQSAQNPGSIKQPRAMPSELLGMVFWMVLARGAGNNPNGINAVIKLLIIEWKFYIWHVQAPDGMKKPLSSRNCALFVFMSGMVWQLMEAPLTV
ncbi:hypothetical protein [Pusillimonas sp. T7-7]|uniref:hypothetical protein n=1 Tax=Pusillimonas sp. (strain T7-7) TaxID=1007105 RepID=UPI0011D18726|nr:hypothetical protein [Pusillimonas sp. T7-7]